MRVIRAFLFAPIPAILLFIAINFGLDIAASVAVENSNPFVASLILTVSTGLVLCYAVILFVALPLFLVLRSISIEGPFVSVICAALIGALFSLGPEMFRVATLDGLSSFSSRIGDCDTIVENVRTACGYTELLKETALNALLGAAAGLTFWQVYQNPNRYKLSWLGIALVVFILASVTYHHFSRDTSCHNSMRDGRTSHSATASLDLIVPRQDLNALVIAFRTFADENGYDFRDGSFRQNGEIWWLAPSVCKEPGISIRAGGVRFENDAEQAAEDVSNIWVHLYLEDQDLEWESDWTTLRALLESRWQLAESTHQQPSGPGATADPGD